MIKRLLIANRGEIAVRIARTAKRMGIECIAVYSEADERSFHARFCKENIIFVGPSFKSIKAMSVKTKARKRIEKLGIPVLSGFDSKNLSFEQVYLKSCSIGFPIMVKAAYGGGGRGMRAVYEKSHLKENLLSAARESKSAFGKDNLLIERLVAKPRHIEVQIIADTEGNVIHLFERDCSVQRNNQKVVEECPAINMSQQLKTQMYNAAKKIAKDINYSGVGTVEFILEGDKFYFMEMNTRLQVEHAITEKITGLDLVQLQLEIASGKKLRIAQENVLSNGHAVECRLYAEDPEENYKPCPGLVKKFEANESINIRIDKGLESGDEVSSYYDSMIAKVISHAKTRKESLKRMSQALKEIKIYGITTNKYFLSNIVSHKNIVDGKYDTNFLKLNLNNLSYYKKDYSNKFKSIIASLWIQSRQNLLINKKINKTDEQSPWSNLTRFRMNIGSIERLFFSEGKTKFEILILHERDRIVFIDEKNKKLALPKSINKGEVVDKSIYFEDRNYIRKIEYFDPLNKIYESSSEKLGLIAPMPGKVVKIFFKIGEEVKENSLVVMIEAMKMEHRITSNSDGKIKKINCKEGDLVKEGALLVELSS